MFIYTVKAGDTIAQLSLRFGVPINQIAADNALANPNNLSIGQSLVISSDSIRYVVKEGQTLFSLSQEFEVPLDELIAANPYANPISLQVGQVVSVPQTDDTPRRPAVLNGYAYPSITDYALECAFPFLTFLSPFSYSITPSGDIIAPDVDEIITASRNNGVMPLMTVTNIFEGTFSTEVLSQILADPEASERLVSSILSEVESKNYYGVNLDMEYISPEDRESYNSLLRSISERLHDNGYILVTAVAPKYRADQQGILYESHDYAEQGRWADFVVIMTYEWGTTRYIQNAIILIALLRKAREYSKCKLFIRSGVMVTLHVFLINYPFNDLLQHIVFFGRAERRVDFKDMLDSRNEFGLDLATLGRR